MSTSISLHRAHVTGDPATCACILREAWPDEDAWPAGQSLHFGNGAFCDFTTLLATRRGHIRCLKYAVENGCALHPKLLREYADVPTQMECFKYALELGLEVDDDAVQAACRNISVTTLKLLIEAYQEQTKGRKRRREGDENNMIVERGTWFIGAVCANVASEQSAEVIKCIDFLRKCGCGWNERATSKVAENGVVSVLKHLVENGCPWDEKTLAAAEKSGDAETIAFAKTHDKKVKQRKSLETMFGVIESRKEQMTEQEYIVACRAAKDLHDSL